MDSQQKETCFLHQRSGVCVRHGVPIGKHEEEAFNLDLLAVTEKIRKSPRAQCRQAFERHVEVLRMRSSALSGRFSSQLGIFEPQSQMVLLLPRER